MRFELDLTGVIRAGVRGSLYEILDALGEDVISRFFSIGGTTEGECSVRDMPEKRVVGSPDELNTSTSVASVSPSS